MDKIETLRQEIDQIHKELHALLERRRDAAMLIWKIKQEQGLPFFSPEREEQILRDFVQLGAKAGKDPQFDTLLKGVMNSVLREYEKYLRSKFPSDS